MNCCLVSCEFNTEDEYEDFYDALNEYPDWRNVFGTQWFVCSKDSPQKIYKNLVKYVYEGDFIFVCEVSNDYACFLPEDTVEWMEENMR